MNENFESAKKNYLEGQKLFYIIFAILFIIGIIVGLFYL